MHTGRPLVKRQRKRREKLGPRGNLSSDLRRVRHIRDKERKERLFLGAILGELAGKFDPASYGES